MKRTFSLVALLLFVATPNAQTRSIIADEYNGNFNGAMYATNRAFPFIFTVATDTFENGQVVPSETQIDELSRKDTSGSRGLSRPMVRRRICFKS